MKSGTLKLYASWLASATPEQTEFVDSVFALCERNYEAGGDQIVECYSPEDIVERFKSMDDVRRCVGLHNEQAMNARWGDDNDPEVNKPAWKEDPRIDGYNPEFLGAKPPQREIRVPLYGDQKIPHTLPWYELNDSFKEE